MPSRVIRVRPGYAQPPTAATAPTSDKRRVLRITQRSGHPTVDRVACIPWSWFGVCTDRGLGCVTVCGRSGRRFSRPPCSRACPPRGDPWFRGDRAVRTGGGPPEECPVRGDGGHRLGPRILNEGDTPSRRASSGRGPARRRTVRCPWWSRCAGAARSAGRGGSVLAAVIVRSAV